MRSERGFTMIEVIVAIFILLVVALGMATTTGRFVRNVAENELEAAAIQLADDRMQLIQMDPDYGALETAYVGSERGFPTLVGFTRETQIVQVGGQNQTLDYKKITVTIRGPGLPRPVARSSTVAAP